MSNFDLTHWTGSRDKKQKVFAISLLGAVGTTYRAIWGICRFIETARCRIFYWLRPGTSTTGTRDQKE